MLLAGVADFAAVPQNTVVSTWDRRLGRFPLSNIDVIQVDSAADEADAFKRLTRAADGTLVIAPETDGILHERLRMIDESSGTSLGVNHRAVEIAADKLETFHVLNQHGVRTPETQLLNSDDHVPLRFPVVIKPRDGAGTEKTFIVRDANTYEWVRCEAVSDSDFVMQSWHDGQSCSVALIGSPTQYEWLPITWHSYSEDELGRIRFLGGEVTSKHRPDLQKVCQAAADAIGWTGGYMGFDCILPADGNEPVIIEINPRLTTSYVGYRALTQENLALRMLRSGDCDAGIAWRDGVVTYAAGGGIRYVAHQSAPADDAGVPASESSSS